MGRNQKIAFHCEMFTLQTLHTSHGINILSIKCSWKKRIENVQAQKKSVLIFSMPMEIGAAFSILRWKLYGIFVCVCYAWMPLSGQSHLQVMHHSDVCHSWWNTIKKIANCIIFATLFSICREYLYCIPVLCLEQVKTIFAAVVVAISKAAHFPRNISLMYNWIAFNCFSADMIKKELFNSQLVINISDMIFCLLCTFFSFARSSVTGSLALAHKEHNNNTFRIVCTIQWILPQWNNDCDLCCVYRFFSQSHILYVFILPREYRVQAKISDHKVIEYDKRLTSIKIVFIYDFLFIAICGHQTTMIHRTWNGPISIDIKHNSLVVCNSMSISNAIHINNVSPVNVSSIFQPPFTFDLPYIITSFWCSSWACFFFNLMKSNKTGRWQMYASDSF